MCNLVLLVILYPVKEMWENEAEMKASRKVHKRHYRAFKKEIHFQEQYFNPERKTIYKRQLFRLDNRQQHWPYLYDAALLSDFHYGFIFEYYPRPEYGAFGASYPGPDRPHQAPSRPPTTISPSTSGMKLSPNTIFASRRIWDLASSPLGR